MSKKVKLTADELAAYKIGSQSDLDRLQQVWNDNLPEPIEFEPFEDISHDVRDYLAAKGQAPQAAVNIPAIAQESVINVDDILEYNKSKK